MSKSHEDGTPLADQPPDATVRQDSDRLFDELSKLKQLETEKQQTLPTTPEFHSMAERVDHQASEVLKAAQDEMEHGQEAAREHEGDDEASLTNRR